MSDAEGRALDRAARASGDHGDAVRALAHRLRVEPPCPGCGGTGWLAERVHASGGAGVKIRLGPSASSHGQPGEWLADETGIGRLSCATCAGENGRGTGSVLRGRVELAAWCHSPVAQDVLGWGRDTPKTPYGPLEFENWLHHLGRWGPRVMTRVALAAAEAAHRHTTLWSNGPPDLTVVPPVLAACAAWLEDPTTERRDEWVRLVHHSRIMVVGTVHRGPTWLPCGAGTSSNNVSENCRLTGKILLARQVTGTDDARDAICRDVTAWALS